MELARHFSPGHIMTWLGRLSPSIRELRVHFKPADQTAQGLRSFLETNYDFMRRNNPHTAILIRPGQAANNTRLVLVKRSDGLEVEIGCSGLSAEEIGSSFQDAILQIERPNKAMLQ